MNDFFKWFITDSNGKEYMTLLHCAREDYAVVLALSVACILIVMQYAYISYYNYIKSKKYQPSSTKKYLLSKVGVFALCGINGYLMVVVSVVVQPYKLRVLLLLVLIIATQFYIRYMRRSGVIDRIYQGEQALREKILKIKKLSTSFNSSVESTHVNWNLLEEAPLGSWIQVNKKVKYRKYFEDMFVKYFDTVIEPGGSFGAHDHDTYERCDVLKGRLKDKLSSKEAGAGESMEFNAYSQHEPYADEKTILKVVFVKYKP